MRQCDLVDECYAICDFCKHHDRSEYNCKLHNRSAYPTDGCDDFYCIRQAQVDEVEAKRKADLDAFTETLGDLWNGKD